MAEAETTNKWYWIGGGTALGIALIILVFALLGSNDPSGSPRLSPTSSGSPTPPPIHQAKWRVHVFPSGLRNLAGRKQKKTAKQHGMRAARGIKDVYNAVFLEPSSIARSVRRHFERGAARAFLRAKTRLPRRMTRTQITYRSMHIGVDARFPKQAVATVKIFSRGIRDSQRVKLKHESTLWLERVHRGWKVLAFRARQGPR